VRDTFDLPEKAPGQYLPVRSDREVPFGKFYKPDALPPELELSEDLITQIERGTHALGRLDGFRSQVPDAEVVFRPLIYKEAEQSSRIEGTNVTTTDMWRATANGNSTTRTRDVQEAINYVDALHRAHDRMLEQGRSRTNITLSLITDLHRTIMEAGYTDEDDPLPGHLRPGFAWIEESSEPWQQSIRFVPPKAEMVTSTLDDLLGYVQSPSPYPAIVDTALVHYQFETIHPFKDGNGRVGRLLGLLMLVACDLLTKPLFYMSAYIRENRQEYTDLLLAVSEEGAWEEWLQFFVRGMRDQAEAVLGRAALLYRLYRSYEKTYDTAPQSVQRLSTALFEQPYLTIPTAAEYIEMTYPTASDAVDRLVEDGVLVQVGDRERNREFVARDVMDIVERDADDLPSPATVLA